MSWKARLRSGIAAISIVAIAAPAGFAESPPAVERGFGPLAVSVAEAHDFSRIEFRWAGGGRMTSRRQGQTLILHFSRYAKPDMTRLRVDPPHWLKTAQDRNAGGLEIQWNGKTIGPVGPRGQVRVVVFTPENFQILPAAAPTL